MSSRRSRLFNYLRIWFFSNLFLFIVLVSWFFYLRHQRSSLLDLVERQLAYNLRLSADLARANDVLTNGYFSAASSFASNVLVSAVSKFSNVSPSPAVGLSSPSSAVSDEVPLLSFSRYFEVNGIPYIRLRNQYLKRGDFVLGYPIEDISPDFVKYRGKYMKVAEDEIKNLQPEKN